MKKIIFLISVLSINVIAHSEQVSVTWRDKPIEEQNIFFKPINKISTYKQQNEKTYKSFTEKKHTTDKYSDTTDKHSSKQFDGPKMISIFGGCLPQNDLNVEWQCVENFFIGNTEVTNAEYALFDSSKQNKNGNAPVVNISLQDAENYISWLQKKTGKNYRLPSKKEWQYVANAGKISNFWQNDICAYANTANCDSKSLVNVASYKANPWGLYDIIGNVWEMIGANTLIVKGGSWSTSDANIKLDYHPEQAKSPDIGFRLVIGETY